MPTSWLFLNGYLIGPGADLFDTTLTNLDLSGADLTGTDFYAANLTGTDLDANLSDASLTAEL